MARIFLFLSVLALTCSLQYTSAEIVAESNLILLGRANAAFDKLENLKMGDSYIYYNVIEYNDSFHKTNLH